MLYLQLNEEYYHMQRTFLTIIVFVCLFLTSSFAVTTEQMMLSGHGTEDGIYWDFYCTAGRKSGEWSKIRVPSCWEQEGFGTYNYGYERNKSSEKGLYKTTFKVPSNWKDKRVFIVFEGSMTDTKVTVNGKQAGDIHQGSFYRFKREITNLISVGADNLLEVEVSKMSSNASVNSAERDADFWVFGGIYRPVYLEAVPQNFIEYTGIDALHDGSFSMELFMDKLVSNATLEVDIYDLRLNRRVSRFRSAAFSNTRKLTVSSSIRNIKSWSAESPNMYRAVITVKSQGKTVHAISERFGFRTVEVRERDGVYINGQRIMFKGVNRHCFWPTTGRTVTREQSLLDAMLIKEMNMNAVRTAHYPPDKHFLEICDSLGLYVINELCAWQRPPYDTQVGTILVNQMLKRDLNHPSVIFWANGNEGGFNHDLDPLFAELDIQKRPLLHPWGLNSGINTVHYITYNSGIKDMFNGRDIFMPTELLHGLYDGGHGAGLDDYWNLMLSNPLSAGLFLWDFSDQGLVRTDRNGELDTDKASGADGILGPYREKEGSFYTIREIWSPIFVEKKYITPKWDGVFNIENRYNFTNTRQCDFSYVLKRFGSLNGEPDVVTTKIVSPDIAPGSKGKLRLQLPSDWKTYDVLYLSATGPDKKEIFTRSYELNSPAFFAEKVLRAEINNGVSVEISASDSLYLLSASGVTAVISKSTGFVVEVRTPKAIIPLSEGPMLISNQQLICRSVTLRKTTESVALDVIYNLPNGREAYSFTWTMLKSGLLQLDYDYRPNDRVEMCGVTFKFPEEGVTGATLFANGPYRVYNNRLKGGTLDIWRKQYNDAITGEVWEYPEFKGYYSLFYGMKLHCATPFEIYCASEDVFLHLFTPTIQQQYDPKINYTHPPYPSGNISFLDAIPAVGTKFESAENYGPQSQRHRYKSYSGATNLKNRLYFKFR